MLGESDKTRGAHISATLLPYWRKPLSRAGHKAEVGRRKGLRYTRDEPRVRLGLDERLPVVEEAPRSRLCWSRGKEWQRVISVLVPLVAVKPFLSLGRLAPVTLIWGGMRGGISAALALSLPRSIDRDHALTATYLIVLFSVIAQGGSIERMLAAASRRISRVRPRRA